MDEDTTKTSGRSGDAWREVGKQVGVLGRTLGRALKASWESEATQRRLRAVQAGLHDAAEDVGEAIRDAVPRPGATELRHQAGRAADEVRPHVLTALRVVNGELQELIERLEHDETVVDGVAEERPEAPIDVVEGVAEETAEAPVDVVDGVYVVDRAEEVAESTAAAAVGAVEAAEAADMQAAADTVARPGATDTEEPVLPVTEGAPWVADSGTAPEGAAVEAATMPEAEAVEAATPEGGETPRAQPTIELGPIGGARRRHWWQFGRGKE